MSQPNVLFLITDQQRADSMGCYGNPCGTTPHLDALAADGLIFDQAYCESPICMPSRTTLLTGKYAAHHRVTMHNTAIHDDERTMADVYNQAGYYTHCIGKMHLYSQERRGNPESLPDWQEGQYDDYTGPFCGFEGADLILGHSNSLYGHYGQWLQEHHPDVVEAFWTDNLEPAGDPAVFGMQNAFRTEIPEDAHSSWYVADMCSKVFDLAEANEQPFFCYASFPDPHWPVCPPGTWFDKFIDAELPPRIPYRGECEREDMPPQYAGIRNGERFYEGGCKYIGSDYAEDMEKIRRGYHAAVAFIDHNVGRIIADLKQRGLYDNTIIIYTTDHGEYLGDHGLQAKGGFLYESFVRTPLIVKDIAPDRQRGRSQAPFSFVDVAQTLCELSDVGCTLATDGVSQAPVCRGAAEQVRAHCTVTHYSFRQEQDAPADQHAIIYQQWKLVYTAREANGLLFNLEQDPQELQNLWHDAEHQSIKQELLMRLFEDLSGRRDWQAVQDRFQILPGYQNHLMTREFWQQLTPS